jgi:invasin B
MTTINPSIATLFRTPAQVDDTQLKDKTARNEGYAKAATQATHQPNAAQLLNAAKQAFTQLGETNFTGAEQPRSSSSDRPSLTPPTAQLAGTPREVEDKFTLLMAQLIMLLGESSVETLKARLEMLKQMSKSMVEGHSKRSEEYLSAVAELEAAVNSASTTEEQLRAVRERIQSAQGQLDAAEAALTGLDPESPEYAAAVQVRDQARTALQQAQQQLAPAVAAHQSAVTAATKAAEKVDEIARKLLVPSTGISPLSANVERGIERELDAGAKMTQLMLQFAELMGQSQETKLSLDQELFEEMQKARQAYMEVKSNEYLEAVRKAEQAKKVACWVSAIVSAVVVVVGAVIAVGSLGTATGLAIGAIGITILALSLTDTVDIMGPIMDPLMKGLMFVLEPFGKLLSELIKYTPLGALIMAVVPEDYRDMAKDIMGYLAAMALLVAGAVLVGGMVGPVLSQVMSKVTAVITKIVDKLVDKFIAPIMEKVTAKVMDNVVMQQIKTIVAEVMKKLADFNGISKNAFSGPNGQLWLSKLQMASVGVEFSGAATSAGANIASGTFHYQGAQALSEVQMLQFISEQLKEGLSRTVEAYIDQAESTTNFINSALTTQEETAASAKFVATQRI